MPTVMMEPTVKPLTAPEIKEMVAEWSHLLDVHAPMVDVLPMLATDGLEMQFPEATLKSLAEFEGWYQGVIRIFFDEVHKLKVCDSKIDGDTAKVHIVVEWHASMWHPPAEKSLRIMCDADQDWIVKRSPVTGKPVVKVYKVNALNYHKGSAKL